MGISKRLFFALWPDDVQRRDLIGIQSPLSGHGGRSTHPADLHLTLVFLGNVDAERQDCVEKAAGEIESRPFDLMIDQVGYWARPRVLWCAPSEVPEQLKALVAALNRGLTACGFEPERRPYAPHVTLARKAGAVPSGRLEAPLRWPVRDFVLVTSEGGRPPHYRVLRRWRL